MGFGLIPSDFRDSEGDTLGGIGSGIDIKRGTWAQTAFGSYNGTFVVTPDRGYNAYVLLFLCIDISERDQNLQRRNDRLSIPPA